MSPNIAAVNRRRWISTGRWRLYLTLVFLSILPLVLFLYAADRLLESAATKDLLVKSGAAADFSVKAINKKINEAKEPLEALRDDLDVVDAWNRGDIQKLTVYLRQARELEPEIAFLAIYDADGTLRASDPKEITESKNEVSSSDWFMAAMQQRATYVSGLSSGAMPPHEPAITMAVPLPRQRPSGVLRASYTISTLRNWINQLPPNFTPWISVVDQNGNIIATPNLPMMSPHNEADPEIKKVLAGQGGSEFVWYRGKQQLVTRRPISPLGWGLLVTTPMEEMKKLLWQLESPFAAAGVLFTAFAIAVGGAFAWVYRKLRASRERIRKIITTANDAFVAIDATGAITDWNPQAEAMFGWSAAKAIGLPLHTTIMPERYRESHLHGMARFFSTGEGSILNNRIEISAINREGHEFPIELSIVHIADGRNSSFNAFIRDISERREAEEQIADLNAELTARVSDLEARNKELEAFGYSVSHDVRAPLRHIEGYSKLLLEDHGGELSSEGREYLECIRLGTRRMHKLINDLLRLSRLGEQALELEKTDLTEVAREVIAGLQRELGSRKVDFEVAQLSTVECDRSLVTQIFWNLLSNAVKFTAPRENAVIQVGEYCGDDQKIIFVRDNGVGFNMEYADKLFAPFQRLHSQEQFEGTGVGLATAQRIVLKHRGRIWADSELGQGATFSFTLGSERLRYDAMSHVESQV